MRKTFPLLFTAMLLNACASPYAYQKEFTNFSSSLTAVSGSITQGLDDISDDQRGADLAAVVSGRTGVDISASCALPAAVSPEPCRLLPHGVRAARLVRADVPEEQLRHALGVVKEYAEGLAAVSNAQDRKDYDAAAAQLASSVGALASSKPSPTAAAAGTVAPAVVKFTAWIIGEGLDQARFDTLRSALNAVGTPAVGSTRSPIQSFAEDVIVTSLAALQMARIELLYRQLDARGNRINSDLARLGPARIPVDRYDVPLMEAAPLTVTLNSVRGVDPAKAASNLVKAHNELVKAVNDPKTQQANLVSSIIDFAGQAETLRQAFAPRSIISALK